MPIIECAECGEKADLQGNRVEAGIEITCNRCGHAWMRDTEPTCPSCGGRNLRVFKEPLIQRARGTAYSIVGEKTIHLCESCDAPELERRARPPDERAPRENPWR